MLPQGSSQSATEDRARRSLQGVAVGLRGGMGGAGLFISVNVY